MCGINGLFGLETLSNPEAIVDRMNQALAHRGPDASGVALFSQACLGHRRLSIIDLSTTADQPMTDGSGRYTLVFNGEIYNFKSLKTRLPNYPFKTNSDTEAVLAAYIEWGPAFLQWLNGMFALAIWDEQEQELFIARDRVGIKPLYYTFQGDSLSFSSEIKGLLATSLFAPVLNKQALPDYLAYQTVHEPSTMLEGVLMLEAGHYMTVKDAEHSIHKYWDASHSAINSAEKSKAQIQNSIKDLLYKSVERRLVSDVPFGAFLSGGIDSSALVGIMSEVSDNQVSTFTVTFDDSEFSEAKYASLVSKKFHTNHHEIYLEPADFLDLIPDALSAIDHPSGDGPNTYVVSKMTKKAGITVAISGLGGDELFAGYGHFMHCYSAMNKKWISQYPIAIRKLLGKLYTMLRTGVPAKKAALVLSALRMDLTHVYPIMRQALMDEQIRGLLPRNEVSIGMEERIHAFEGDWSRLPLLSQVSMAEMHTYMRNVLLRDTDQMSMDHALEVRVPFLDHELIEFVIGVRDEVKFPTSPKSLLVDSLGSLLPREIIDRPKMGFTLPWVHWMKNELRTFCEEHLTALKERGIMDPSMIERLWNKFLSGDSEITWSRIWPLIVLENWMQRYDVQT